MSRIIAADFSPPRRNLARQMGADEAVDARTASAVARAAELAPGAAVGIFENSGAAGVLGRVIRAVRRA
ncbi:zinc-binding dehydrogenase [Phenylobacterium sp. J367]|uniref:zinc-binding dehydrogenase n=1 Tax=Phenylobacterium sp. J367 TaxID=2898435 RepID=UPI002150F0A5|nr:zinc-binding dehydrogenase [Phenylobacterium sp. J367]MCR5880658.1 hypothetical protein [Phenylobacterium sp. J367]